MPLITQLDTDVSTHFFEPLRQVYPKTEARYVCHAISDLDYAVLGILRCMSHAKTGHEFLQHHIDHGREGATVDHFFKALKSGRRLTNLTSLNVELGEVMKEKVADPFQGLKGLKGLKGFDFYAADAYYFPVLLPRQIIEKHLAIPVLPWFPLSCHAESPLPRPLASGRSHRSRQGRWRRRRGFEPP